MISSEDIAYLAGLFDGEGSIYFAKRVEKKKKHVARLEMRTMSVDYFGHTRILNYLKFNRY